MRKILSVLSVLAVAMVAPNAYAINLVTNGSFEIGAPSGGCQAGATSLSGWTVTAGNIDIDSATPGCSGITPADGTYFVDLTGSWSNDVGAIAQDITTAIGTQYNLSFYFTGNPQWQVGAGCASGYANDGATKAMRVTAGAVTQTFSVDTTGASCVSPQWTLENVLFTATSTTTTLLFQSLNGATAASVYGPLLDGVSVNVAPVPEPATLGMLVLGIAGLGFARRRKI